MTWPPAPPLGRVSTAEVMIEADRVSKDFGTVRALDSVSITARKGTVLALVGHNGAGKTTLVNILSTALTPSAGTARIAGFDVARQPREVRKRIGLTGQFASVDGKMTGRGNLLLIARLLGAGRRAARVRADALLELFDLGEVAGRRVGTYSGGLRRRLDLAVSLVGRPDVIFLDEPTTGLDPTSRLGMWGIVERLVSEGTTVLLTTQYLEEADRLADAIVVLAAGRVVAGGTPVELKARVGQRTVTVTLSTVEETYAAMFALRSVGLVPAMGRDRNTVTLPIRAAKDIAFVVARLDHAGIDAGELKFGHPSLDEVYLALAGRREPPVTVHVNGSSAVPPPREEAP